MLLLDRCQGAVRLMGWPGEDGRGRKSGSQSRIISGAAQLKVWVRDVITCCFGVAVRTCSLSQQVERR